MNRLALTATIGAVLVAAILGLIYAISKQDVDDTPEPTAQTQPANPASTQNTASTQPAQPSQGGQAPAQQAQQTQAQPSQAQPAQSQSGQSRSSQSQSSQAQQPAPAQRTQSASSQPATNSDTQATASASTAPAAQSPAATAPATNTQVASAASTPPPPVRPSFDVVRVNPNGDAVVAGRAAPGAKITLLDNGQPVGSATADDRGEWVLLPDSAVDPGQHKFSLKAQDEDGKSEESEKEVIVVVPKPAEDIAGQPVTKPSGALAIEVPKQGEGPTQLLNAPDSTMAPSTQSSPQPSTQSSTQASNQATPQPASASAEASPSATPAPPLSLDTIDYTQDGRAMLSGHTLPGSDLIIYLDNASLGAAKADQNGRWTFVPETKAPTGDHEVRVDMVDGAGKVQSRVKVPFAQPDFSQVKLTDDTVIVQPGNSLWRIARKTYGHGVQYTVIYEANKDRIGDPNLIYPGQIFTLPKSKTSGG
jgi:nucleoid-associated protein YgaU